MQASTDFATIVNAINSANGVVKDDHRGAGTRTVAGVATLLRNGRHHVVSLHNAKYFSLNDMYLGEDGMAHISPNSCGGVVELFDLSMEQAILNYNEGQTTNMFCYSFLLNIHLLQDGKLVPIDLVTAEQVVEMQATAKAAYDAWKNRDSVNTHENFLNKQGSITAKQ